MFKAFGITFALVLAAAVLLPDTARCAGLSIEQMLDIEQVRAADLSPDGKLAAYTVSQNRALEDEPGGAWVELYVVATTGGQPRPFVTGKVAVSNVHFSPDGRFLGFTTKRGDEAKTQVWVIPVNGGEAIQATDSPTGVTTYAWSHDGAAIYYVDTEDAPQREKDLKEKKWTPKFFEENLRHRILHRVAFSWGDEPGAAEALVEGMSVWGIEVDPTGAKVAFGASELNLVDYEYMFQDIYALDLATGTYERVVDTPGKLGVYRISPDGKYLVWTAAATRQDHAVSSLFLAGLDGSNPVNITAPDFPGHIRSAAWWDERTVMFQADEGVYATLSLQRVDKGTLQERKVIFDGAAADLVIGAPASRPGVKTMVMVGHNSTTPRELYAWDGQGSGKRLTRHNPFLADVELGEQRVVTWNARDGLEIEGMLILPLGYTSGTFPLVVYVHGGPESHVSNGWVSRYSNPGQVMSARGFGYLIPNYRGSTGRGIAYAGSAFGDPAGKEFEDIIDGVDHLVREGLVDKDNVGVMGGSYGGFAANWMATYHTEHFKAAAAFVGVSEQVSKRFLTNIPYEDEYVHMGVAVRNSWDLMRERSPVTYADQSRTALLILHGEDDRRVHSSQSQMMFRALKMAGHPAVRLIWYPGEGHGNRKRFEREDFTYRNVAWFEYYLKQGNAWDGPLPPLDISEDMGLLKD